MGYVPEFASYDEVLISEEQIQRGPSVELYQPAITDEIYQTDSTVVAKKKDGMFENLTALHYVSIIGLLGAASMLMRGK